MDDLSTYTSPNAAQTPEGAENAGGLSAGVRSNEPSGLRPREPVAGRVDSIPVPRPGRDAAPDAAAPPPSSNDAAADRVLAPIGPPSTDAPNANAALGPEGSFPGALMGASRQNLRVARLDRSFIYYAPPGLDPDVPAPVLIVAHGFGQTAAEMFDVTRFDSIADREGFVVLYPDGQGLVPWNIGDNVCQGVSRTVATANGDDSAFVDAMLAFVSADRRVDTEHVFASGLASGGYFANELGCQRPDIRAVASHSGGSHPLDACASTHKPVLLLHGLADPVVAAECSAEARARWVEHNGCEPMVDTGAALGGTCELSLGCPAGGQVMLCTFEGMGQGWAGGGAQNASFLDFASASELIWEFFVAYAW